MHLDVCVPMSVKIRSAEINICPFTTKTGLNVLNEFSLLCFNEQNIVFHNFFSSISVPLFPLNWK